MVKQEHEPLPGDSDYVEELDYDEDESSEIQHGDGVESNAQARITPESPHNDQPEIIHVTDLKPPIIEALSGVLSRIDDEWRCLDVTTRRSVFNKLHNYVFDLVVDLTNPEKPKPQLTTSATQCSPAKEQQERDREARKQVGLFSWSSTFPLLTHFLIFIFSLHVFFKFP